MPRERVVRFRERTRRAPWRSARASEIAHVRCTWVSIKTPSLRTRRRRTQACRRATPAAVADEVGRILDAASDQHGLGIGLTGSFAPAQIAVAATRSAFRRGCRGSART
jgi:hypothetical protein